MNQLIKQLRPENYSSHEKPEANVSLIVKRQLLGGVSCMN